MSTTACLCARLQQPRSEPPSYPEWADGEDNAAKLRHHGYIVARGLLSNQEIEETKQQISRVISEWYKEVDSAGKTGTDLEETVNILPEVREGKLNFSDPELAIRKLYRMCVHHQYFADLCKNPKIVPCITDVLGPDVKLLQSMALLKPPGSGVKDWHQDNAYFRLTPCKVMGCWIALDPTDCSNGCMHVLPGSHDDGVYKHASMMDSHLDYSMVERPQPEHVVPVILNPGDALLFHGQLAHYTPPNVTDARRRSIQFHYAASECRAIRCPKEEKEELPAEQSAPQEQGKPRYFDCDGDCHEPYHSHLAKAEILVCGRDLGGEYI